MKTFLKILTAALVALSGFLVMASIGNYEADLVSTGTFFMCFFVGTAGCIWGFYILDQLIEQPDWEEIFGEEEEFIEEDDIFEESDEEDSLLAQMLYFEEEKKNRRRRTS